MEARKKRIKLWVIFAIIAMLLLGAEALYKNVIIKEKEPFMVYAPNEMEGAFNAALRDAKLKSDYKIVLTDNKEEAMVRILYSDDIKDKPFKEELKPFAFSPFIVGYSPDDSHSKKLKEKSLVEVSPYSSMYEIDLTKLIDAVIDGKNLKDYGIDGYGKIKVVYPDKSTVYWYDFYNLMLITANNGDYPVTSSEYNKAVSKLNQFFASENAKAVTNFSDEVIRHGGFSPDIFYIMPEYLFVTKAYYVDYLYPTETIYFNCYIEFVNLGSQISRDNAMKKHSEFSDNFYEKLGRVGYRTKENQRCLWNNSYIQGVRNEYNIVPISEVVSFKIEKEE